MSVKICMIKERDKHMVPSEGVLSSRRNDEDKLRKSLEEFYFMVIHLK